MLRKCLCVTIVALIFVAIAAFLSLFYFYQIKVEGELVLDRAPGKVKIIREADTKILKIKGENWSAVSYGQGFACA